MATPGKAGILNKLKGLSSVVMATTAEINAAGHALPKGVLIYNTDTGELKVNDGVLAPDQLSDHKHPYTYAPLIHSHMFGTNQPWLVTNPKLWYRDDLVNHPELVPLEGGDTSSDQATELAKYLPGTRLLTNPTPTMSGSGFENNELTLSVDTSAGDYLGGRLFNEELTISNFAQLADQWLTGDTGLTGEHTVTVQFKNGRTYRPASYWIIPAAGVSEKVMLLRPTPKNWVFEGDPGDGKWETIDQQTNVTTGWEACTLRTFEVSTTKAYSGLRLRITEWNAGEEEGLETGLRRLWIFGRKPGVFSLPDIPSPHPDYVWVIPYANINTGLKHEDIGDIGTTGIPSNLLPAYRLPTKGQKVAITDYEELFAVIGNQYSPTVTPSAITPSEGEMSGAAWNAGFAETDAVAYVDFTVAAGMLSAYTLDISGYRHPLSWTVEAKTSTGSFVTLQSFTDVDPTDFDTAGGHFSIDTTIDDGDYTTIRINFLEWEESSDPIGFAGCNLQMRTSGQFYLPNITTEGATTTYIVARNTADDVSADIIQRLQQNVIDLANDLAALQNQVNNLDESIDKPTETTE